MSKRSTWSQSIHDAAVNAIGLIYFDHGKHAWMNPDSEKNQSWNGYFIDVIASHSANTRKAWLIEVETEDTVSETEAQSQWKDYDLAYRNWFLAVPADTETEANRLILVNNIKNCIVITWQRNQSGKHTFWGLPGLS